MVRIASARPKRFARRKVRKRRGFCDKRPGPARPLVETQSAFVEFPTFPESKPLKICWFEFGSATAFVRAIMHTAPATSTSFATVLSPGPSSPSQVSSKGTTAKQSPGQFQQVYQNVSESSDNGTGDQSASRNIPSRKKEPAQETANTVVSTTPPAPSSNAAPLSSILTLASSSVSTAQPTIEQPSTDALELDAAQVGTSTQPVNSGSESANLISVTEQATSQSVLPVLHAQTAVADPETQKSLAKAASQTLPSYGTTFAVGLQPTDSRATNEEESPNASNGPTASAPLPQTQSVPSVQSSRTFPPALDLNAVEQISSATALPRQESGYEKNSDASAQAPLYNAIAARPVPLSADNLAFALALSTNDAAAAVSPTPSGAIARPVADARPLSPATQAAAVSAQSSTGSADQPAAVSAATSAVAQSYAIADDTKISIAPTAGVSPTISRGLPNVTSAPDESRTQASPDTTSRQQQDSTGPGSSQRAASTSANQQTTDRAQSSASDKDSLPIGSQNVAANTNRPAQLSVPSWLASDTQPSARPASSSPGRSAAAESNIPASLQDLHALAADAPKTTAPSEIVLHLDNGQTSAAVRVVDRAGSVNVSVHASDQELRTSLRTNLNDLSSQLNAQGVKTESTRTGSSQASSENRQDQGPQDQRSNGQQQQSSPQGDRQSPRGRRATAQWLNELQEQTSFANPGGNH